jgi:alanine racemase
MGRLGLLMEQDPDFFSAVSRSKNCLWEGLYSHFSTADEKDKVYADLQIKRFQKILGKVRKMKKGPQIIHIANSGAILDLPKSYFSAVRPGILLYGHYPSRETSRSINPRQVMTLKTFVAHVRRLPKGYPVSYGRRWIAPKDTRIAVLPIGYADGLRRDLTNKGEVLIKGTRYPMVGSITMDYTMVDVGEDPVEQGDEVVLWGDSDQGSLSLIEIAAKIGTIPYELTCCVSPRVKRVYI